MCFCSIIEVPLIVAILTSNMIEIFGEKIEGDIENNVNENIMIWSRNEYKGGKVLLLFLSFIYCMGTMYCIGPLMKF